MDTENKSNQESNNTDNEEAVFKCTANTGFSSGIIELYPDKFVFISNKGKIITYQYTDISSVSTSMGCLFIEAINGKSDSFAVDKDIRTKMIDYIGNRIPKKAFISMQENLHETSNNVMDTETNLPRNNQVANDFVMPEHQPNTNQEANAQKKSNVKLKLLGCLIIAVLLTVLVGFCSTLIDESLDEELLASVLKHQLFEGTEDNNIYKKYLKTGGFDIIYALGVKYDDLKKIIGEPDKGESTYLDGSLEISYEFLDFKIDSKTSRVVGVNLRAGSDGGKNLKFSFYNLKIGDSMSSARNTIEKYGWKYDKLITYNSPPYGQYRALKFDYNDHLGVSIINSPETRDYIDQIYVVLH